MSRSIDPSGASTAAFDRRGPYPRRRLARCAIELQAQADRSAIAAERRGAPQRSRLASACQAST